MNRRIIIALVAASGLLLTAAITVLLLSRPDRPPFDLSSPVSGVTGCALSPSICGFPDATNTGVPESVRLRRVPHDVSEGPGWAWDERGWVSITVDGTVFEGFDVAANVDVVAAGVTIRNCRIRVTGDSFGISLRRVRDVTIETSEISGPSAGADRLMVGIKDIYGDSTGVRILRNEIWHTTTGIQLDAGLIQDNYIHSMGYREGDHLNGTTSNGGRLDWLAIDHNTVFNQFAQTDAISLFQDFGAQANRVISNNLVAGGAYTIYGGAKAGGKPTTNIRITDNRIARTYFPNGGDHGPLAAFDPAGRGNRWSGNVWDDTGLPVQ